MRKYKVMYAKPPFSFEDTKVYMEFTEKEKAEAVVMYMRANTVTCAWWVQ